jgi:hypothetical protein
MRADIRLQLGLHGVRYIDVTVVSPCSATAIRNDSCTVPSAAATHQEHVKRTKYAQALTQADIPQEHFIAFAMEASGRYGKEAFTFLEDLTTLGHLKMEDQAAAASIQYYKRLLRSTIMIGNQIAILSSGNQSI